MTCVFILGSAGKAEIASRVPFQVAFIAAETERGKETNIKAKRATYNALRDSQRQRVNRNNNLHPTKFLSLSLLQQAADEEISRLNLTHFLKHFTSSDGRRFPVHQRLQSSNIKGVPDDYGFEREGEGGRGGEVETKEERKEGGKGKEDGERGRKGETSGKPQTLQEAQCFRLEPMPLFLWEGFQE